MTNPIELAVRAMLDAEEVARANYMVEGYRTDNTQLFKCKHCKQEGWGLLALAHPVQHSTGCKLYVRPRPVDMILHCPQCHQQHIDEAKVSTPDFDSMPDDPGFREEHPDWPACVEAMRKWQADNWTNPPHRKHLCAHCGCEWTPANVPTNGVAAL